ncbi:protein FAR1-RELATED SEQUENCE 12-like [Asparagus officinalis]|uniref:protein FAR1-RELATED SEQUENCE 12-like n=1 Tax=Asparagus officinalis TaxID=4686 RepID=UPI00098E7FC0|nr:protein FAR1-RELATED SEQUENCE 12-like [Asparagus officinalis]
MGGGDRCRAMMEVMRTENGRWSVSKVILQHTHPISSQDPSSSEILPKVGMNFESISMAKAFYIAYSERMGFKAKTGSGRRSKGTRMLIMQRFFCSKGNYLVNSNVGDDMGVKRKRGSYKKKVSNKDGENAEVVQVESSVKRTSDLASEDQEKDRCLREKEKVVERAWDKSFKVYP